VSKLSDYSFKQESKNQREFNQDVRDAWNESRYEIKVISDITPGWTETVNGIPVYSTSSKNLFISDITTTNKWVAVTMTAI